MLPAIPVCSRVVICLNIPVLGGKRNRLHTKRNIWGIKKIHKTTEKVPS